MRKAENNYFAITTVSSDVKIVNAFVFTAIWMHLYPDFNSYAFRQYNFRARKSPPPLPLPMSKVLIHWYWFTVQYILRFLGIIVQRVDNIIYRILYMTVQWISVDKNPPHCPLGSDLLNGLQNASFELLGPSAFQIQISVREFKYLGYIWRFCNNIKSKKTTIWIAGIESWCLKWKIKRLWANVLSSMQQFV